MVRTDKEKKILYEFLNVYWLRPETALWRTIDTMVMNDFVFEEPSLDLGCGDGIFSFVRAGGCFNYSFDMFQSVAGLDKFFENVDVYDHFDKNFLAPVVKDRPSYMIDVAIDHKEALLKKAATLGLYKKLLHHDANKPLPFADKSFKTVFSNIVYWLDSPADTFKEIARILEPGGKALVMLPNESFREYSFYYRLYLKTGDSRWKWLEKIDRGRMSQIKHAYGKKAWEKIFNDAKLKTVTHRRHLSKTVIEAWDIGLRPLFPVLHKMAGKLAPADRIEVKKDWIDLVAGLVEPLCQVEWLTDKEHPPAFHSFVLVK